MTATKTSTPEALWLESIREILKLSGPSITILLPSYRPGQATGSPRDLLKSYLHDAERQLMERGYPKPSLANLLEPLLHVAADPDFGAGAQWGYALLRSPEAFEQFQLTQPVEPSLTIGGSFEIRKLARELARPHAFYILALAKNKVGLLRCAGLHAEQVKLPTGVPATLAEALALEPPDHDLENRAAAGSSAGAMHRIRFGTGSGSEQEHGHLSDYYKIVDRGLREAFYEPCVPLILAGVEEDVAEYRAISAFPDLAEAGIIGSPDLHGLEQPAAMRLAYSILHDEAEARNAAALLVSKERTHPDRFSVNADTLLHAAFEGRVAQLYVNEEATLFDVFERGSYRSWGKEDLLNLALVQTILHHGKAFVLPAKDLPAGAPMAGLLRF